MLRYLTLTTPDFLLILALEMRNVPQVRTMRNMRSGLLTLIGTVVLVWSASAQDQAGRAKYEVIRETINFLATDRVVSKDTNFRISCETLDYDCFRRQLSSQPIAGIERWYNTWRSMTATDEAGLVSLRNQIFTDIFERQGKGYRRQLAGYEEYISRVGHLIEQYPDGVTMVDTAMDTTGNAMLTSSDAATLLSPDPTQFSSTEENSKETPVQMVYFALATGIIALLLAVVSLLRKKARQFPVEFHRLPEQLDEMSLRLKRLERQTSDPQIKDAVVNLTEIMESVEKRVVALENDFRADRR